MLTRNIADNFICCLDEERYYDAHVVLEDLWFPHRKLKTPEILLLKGLINASVSFELHKRGRPHKAPGPWNVYMKYRAYLDSVGSSNILYHDLDQAVHSTQARFYD